MTVQTNLDVDKIHLAPLDVERFWADDEIAHQDPFGEAIPQFPMGIQMGYFSMFTELGLEQDLARLERDYPLARQYAKAYNDRSQRIVGRRLLNEEAYDPAGQFPHVKGVGELFGCERVWQSESWWLLEAAHTPAELAALLDRMDTLDIEAAMFPDNWDAACQTVYNNTGRRPYLHKGLRGPVTLATSIYGTENLIFLLMDEPDLAERFRDAILRVVLEYYTICDRVTGADRAGPGFAFYDDNCALLTPELYAMFGQPILHAVFDRFAPGAADRRYQHSDSDMEHLLPLLAETGLNRVNFGPNVRFADIRRAMPHAVVEGTLAPFTFMRNDEVGIVRELHRDFDEARATRGLVVATAGSVNDGSLLSSLRLVMSTIQHDGRLR